MKLTFCLGAPLLALLAFPAGLRAATPDAEANPYANVDPDGVPLAVTQQSREAMTPEQIEASDKQEVDEEARARNWLLLQYEQEFRRSAPVSSPRDQTLNMYLQLSMNKELSDVAGQAADAANPAPAPSLHAMSKSSAQNGLSLRPDVPDANRGFTPLISPLSSPGAVSATQPFDAGAYAAALPPSLAPTSPLDVPRPAVSAPAPSSKTYTPPSPTDTIDMETPGAIADKSNPLPGTPDLNLDSLPDQTNTQNTQQADEPAQLPEAMDAGLLHEELKEKLDPQKPTPAKVAVQQPVQPTTTPTPPAPEAPEPINKQPQLSPEHAPLPNPFDILNR
ncbi:MAG TPA: hypothetical protein VHY09_03710 [Candidatus Methylacidiphilales bacterium]|jgi:hypothetical protein|nr:hypothetical protein [Candidatus Methylacidiphilales bacterium]